MPFDPRIKMKNIRRFDYKILFYFSDSKIKYISNTPTSTGPNSYGKFGSLALWIQV